MRFFKPAHPYLLNALLISKYTNKDIYDEVKVDDGEENEGWKRLKKMYSFGKGGLASPQFSMVTDTGFTAFLMGFMIGSMKESSEAYHRFIEANKTTMFKHHLQAKRQLQDTITISMFRGGWKVGWRLGLVTTSMITLILSMHTYRGYSSVGEFSAAGAITCGLYKLKEGPKPCLSGAFVGGAFGTVAGIAIVGLMRITGVTFDNLFENEMDRINKYNEETENRTEEQRKKVFKDYPYKPEIHSLEVDIEDSKDKEANLHTEDTNIRSS